MANIERDPRSWTLWRVDRGEPVIQRGGSDLALGEKIEVVPADQLAGAVEAERWLAWLDSDRNNDGDVPLKGTPYQAAQRIAKRLHDYERGQ